MNSFWMKINKPFSKLLRLTGGTIPDMIWAMDQLFPSLVDLTLADLKIHSEQDKILSKNIFAPNTLIKPNIKDVRSEMNRMSYVNTVARIVASTRTLNIISIVDQKNVEELLGEIAILDHIGHIQIELNCNNMTFGNRRIHFESLD